MHGCGVSLPGKVFGEGLADGAGRADDYDVFHVCCICGLRSGKKYLGNGLYRCRRAPDHPSRHSGRISEKHFPSCHGSSQTAPARKNLPALPESLQLAPQMVALLG